MPRPGPTDVVPAMLTPGEAVLVPEVAEAVGRHNIEAANQHAVAKRKGIIPLQGYSCGAGSVQGYAVGTPDVQQNNSAVQTSVKEPLQAPNMVNQSTGVTTVGGGNNGQSTANKFTNIAPPMVGMPGVASGPADNNLAKNNLFARTALDSASRLGKAGNMDAATGIMQDLNKSKPIVSSPISTDMNIDSGESKFTAMADQYGVQGYEEGTGAVKEPKFKVGVSDFTPTPEQANPGSFPAVESAAPAPKQQAVKIAPPKGEPKFKGGVSEFSPSDAALKEANQTYLTEQPVKQPVPAKPARTVGGQSAVGEFTPSAEDIAGQRYNPVEGKASGLGNLPQAEAAIQQGLHEKSLGVPQTGPYSNVPPRPTIEAGKNPAPITRRGIVPVGEVTSEPTKYQFRPGAGGYAPEVQAPGTDLVPAGPRITAEEANKAYGQFEAEQAAKAAPKVKSAAASAAEDLANPKPSGAWRPMTAAEAAKQSAQAAAEKAAAPGWETGMRQATAPSLKGVVPVVGKTLGAAGTVLGAAHNFSQPAGVEVYAKKRAEMGDPQAQQVVAEGGVNPVLQKAKYAAESAATAVERPVAEAVTGAVNKILPSREEQAAETAPGLPQKAATEQPLPAGASLKNGATVGKDFPEVGFGNPSLKTKVEPQAEEAFAPKDTGNGQYRVDLDDKGQFVQSANKAGMERVAKGLRERGGIVKAASKPAGAVSDFWVNQGYPGGAAQYQAEKQQKALENLALNGGGTGNMSVSEFRRANAQQKAAQGILADRERANVQREHLASENKKSEASLAATGAEREYQHRKDVKEDAQKQAEYEQRERLAGDKPVKIGEDIMPTRDVPAYQARKAHEAKVATLSDYVKKNSGLFSGSPEDALVEGLIQHGDQEGSELAELKAYLNVAKPEQKKAIEAEIKSRVNPYRSALNG